MPQSKERATESLSPFITENLGEWVELHPVKSNREGNDKQEKAIWKVPELQMSEYEMLTFFRRVVGSKSRQYSHTDNMLFIEARMQVLPREGRAIEIKFAYSKHENRLFKYYYVTDIGGGPIFNALGEVEYISASGKSKLSFQYRSEPEQQKGWFVQGDVSQGTLYNLACAILVGKPIDDATTNLETVIEVTIGDRNDTARKSRHVEKLMLVEAHRKPSAKKARAVQTETSTHRSTKKGEPKAKVK